MSQSASRADDSDGEGGNYGQRVLQEFGEKSFVDAAAIASATVINVESGVAVRTRHRRLSVDESAKRVSLSIPEHEDYLDDRRSMRRRYDTDPDDFVETTVEYVEHDPPRSRCDSCDGTTDVTCPRCSGRGEIPCRNCDGTGRATCERCGTGARLVEATASATVGTDVDFPGSGTITCNRCGGDGTVTRNVTRHVESDLGGYDEHITEEYDCPACQNGEVPCPRCEGSGNVPCMDCGPRHIERCPKCRGDAEVTCPDCAGHGAVVEPILGTLSFQTDTQVETDVPFLGENAFRDADWTHARTVVKRDASSGDVGGDGIIRWTAKIKECPCTRVEYSIDGTGYATVDVDGRLVADGAYPKSTFRRLLPVILLILLAGFVVAGILTTDSLAVPFV